MVSTVLFVAMAIIAIILLIIASVTASITAADVFGSPLYNTELQIRAAHQYATIAAILGWSSVAVLLLVFIVAAFTGGFTTTEVSEALLSKDNLNKADIITLYTEEKELSTGQITRVIVLVVLIIVAIITFIVGVLAAIAAGYIGSAPVKDAQISSAYTYAIISAVSGIAGIIFMIIAIITYAAIRSVRATQLKEVQERERKAQIAVAAGTVVATPTVLPA
jgi:hypothetical protein